MTKTVTYMYDPFNHWIGETVSVPGQAVQQTRFVYDGSQIALEFDMTGSGNLSAGNLSHRYLWGPAADQLVADEAVTSLTSPGTVDWLLADGQGTIRDIATYNVQTNQTTIANHRVFGAWGELESQTNSAVECLFGYTGRPFDSAASLQNNGERWYDSVTGRWLSEDPAGFAAGDPNLTRYVGNGPANATDPSGLADGGTGSPYNNGNGCVGCQGYALMSAGPDGQGGDAEDIDGGGPAEGDVMFVVPTGGGGAQNTSALAGTRPAPHGFVMFGARFVAPWDENAAGFWDSLRAWGHAGSVAGTGAGSGAATGDGVGAAGGAVVGGIGGLVLGPGAGLTAGGGAIVGGVGGGIGGGIGGLVRAFNAPEEDTYGNVAWDSARAGAVSGVISSVTGPIGSAISGGSATFGSVPSLLPTLEGATLQQVPVVVTVSPTVASGIAYGAPVFGGVCYSQSQGQGGTPNDGLTPAEAQARWEADIARADRVAGQMGRKGYSARDIAQWRAAASQRAQGRLYRALDGLSDTLDPFPAPWEQ